uniref:Uncharacterized protein n=1 Tax=Setaria viridis TaxID=4556 RepID=A0A4U6TWB9_SETVI|nr:hypothetical protein SEVIR_8G219800v2 [Setaria viridis]
MHMHTVVALYEGACGGGRLARERAVAPGAPSQGEAQHAVSSTTSSSTRPFSPPRNGMDVGAGSALGMGASKKFERSSKFVKLEYHMGPVVAALGGDFPEGGEGTVRSFITLAEFSCLAEFNQLK